jgi:hypothetical protein
MNVPALPRGLWQMILYDLDCQDALQIWGTCKELSGTLDKCDIAASAFALTRPKLSATFPLALKHWVKVLHQCMEAAKVEDWAQSMLIHTEEYNDDADDDHALVSWPAPRQHSPCDVVELMGLIHGGEACPSLCLDAYVLAMTCMVLIGPSCTSQCRIHMRALCFVAGHGYQVFRVQYASGNTSSIRDIAVCSIDHPADGIAVLPSISGRLDLWESIQLWHTTDDVDKLQWLPCFYDPDTRAPFNLEERFLYQHHFFQPRNAVRLVQRQAQDCIVYTCGEFIHWYGTHLGRQRWLEAQSEDEQRLKVILRRAFPSSGPEH